MKKEAIGYGYDSVFPTRLRELLSRPEMTQEKLASHLDIARQSVAQWKDGKTMPDIHYLGKIAEHFGVSADWLLGLSDLSSVKNNELSVNALGLSEKFINYALNLKQLIPSEHLVFNLFLTSNPFYEIAECLSMLLKILPVSERKNDEDIVELYRFFNDKVFEASGGQFTVANSGFLKEIAKFSVQSRILAAVDEVIDILERKTQSSIYREYLEKYKNADADIDMQSAIFTPPTEADEN